MTMPRNLVFLRHGQSLRNWAGRLAYENGDLSLFNDIITRPSSVAPLTEQGERQAAAAGLWLQRQNFKFGRMYTSTFNRAKQTAGLLGLPGRWYIDNNIRERSGGVMEDMTPEERKRYLAGIRSRAHEFDPFNFRPDRGESYADVSIRLTLFFGTLHRELANDDVLVVNHGDNMWVGEYLLRRWTTEQFVAIRGDGHGKIPNCMVIHYTRVDPYTGGEAHHLNWVRTCCPWKDSEPSPWVKIDRESQKYTSEDLLAQVAESRLWCEFPQASPEHRPLGL